MRVVFQWAFDGFADSVVESRIRFVYAALCVWLLPAKGHGARTNKPLWMLCNACSTVLGLRCLGVWHSRRHYLRVLLRGFPPLVHGSLLYNNFDHNAWRNFVVNLALATARPERCGELWAGTYVVLSHTTSTWYCGKANLSRHSGPLHHSGLPQRFREHWEASHFPALRDKPEARYKAWSMVSPDNLFFVPFVFGAQSHILRFEDLIIATLRPPTQSSQHGPQKSVQTKSKRPWPNQRTKPTTQQEPALNVFHRLRTDESFACTWNTYMHTWTEIL
jgi:hypothetical protein